MLSAQLSFVLRFSLTVGLLSVAVQMRSVILEKNWASGSPSEDYIRIVLGDLGWCSLKNISGIDFLSLELSLELTFFIPKSFHPSHC